MNNDRFKFRVWNKKYNCYDFCRRKFGILYIQEKFRVSSGYDGEDKPTFCEDVNDNYIIEQCTGLKDKNGKLIYEGDVIQFTHNRGYFTNKGDIRVIEFSAFRFCGFGWRSRPENNVDFALTESAAKKCVVIGNIHEQAEQKDVK